MIETLRKPDSGHILPVGIDAGKRAEKDQELNRCKVPGHLSFRESYGL